MENVSLRSKINEIRVALSEDMSKSGKNTYSKYDYFQLKDFMPRTLNLCNAKGVYTEFWISKDKRDLPSKTITTETFDENGAVTSRTITEEENFEYVENAHLIAINLDDENDVIELIKETANVNLSGAQPIQNLGGKSTYMKRYMYMDLLEINENDKVEEQTGKPTIVESKTSKATKPVVKTVSTKKVEKAPEEVTPADFEPKKEEVKVEQPTINTEEVMTMAHKVELANYMKEKGLDPRKTIVEAAKELGTDVPLLKESDFEKIKEFVNGKVGE